MDPTQEGTLEWSPEGSLPAIKTGSGWRFGRNLNQHPYTTLLGSDTWAVELTEREWQSFFLGLKRLWQTFTEIQNELMPEEAITLEQQTPELTLILTGIPPQQIRLFLQIHTGRGAEGFWEPEAVFALVTTILASKI
jgi:hypothetical protein